MPQFIHCFIHLIFKVQTAVILHLELGHKPMFGTKFLYHSVTGANIFQMGQIAKHLFSHLTYIDQAVHSVF
jgi:hypothetical protein